MSNGVSNVNYDDNGRLTGVNYPNGGSITYSYDAMGNRTSVIAVPASTPPPYSPPTVAALPKPQTGDFKNRAMMVLLSDGTLCGWGDNTTGALANGVLAATNAPAQRVLFDPNSPVPPFNATIVDWAFTNANLYVVYSNGWVYSAGSNDYGQLGHGDTTARPYLKRIEYFPQNYLPVMGVWACGGYGTTNGGGCVYFQTSNKSLYACGANAAGNLGNAATPTTNVSTPAPCAGVDYVSSYAIDVQIACCSASFSTYMVMSDGSLLVAGYNGQGQLATGSTTNVTGAFTDALQPGPPPRIGPMPMSNVIAVSANAGYYSGSGLSGNALVITTPYAYGTTTGFNGHGELGQGNTTNVDLFEENVIGLTIRTAQLGGGYVGFGYAITATGQLYTWGYNGQDNLFLNNSTTPQTTPMEVTILPGNPSAVFIPKGNDLATNAQLTALVPNGLIIFAGQSNGQLGLNNIAYPGAYQVIPTPLGVLQGSETITDVFVHGASTTQRWFVLTNLGNLYACGSNVDSICTGGLSSNSMQANTAWQKISFC